ncbi:MAG: nucleotidyltransferase family protein, partial [Deltaproteobacteria bacterium]|nr:nucleotidyltransferase family protein [Deltaproteobacteria bacterium]
MSLNSAKFKGMILAAGKGTRLQPLTHTTPKSLILVNQIPLIVYQIRLFKKYGVRDILINLHHLGGMIEKELADGSRYGVRISYSYEESILGTGGGIKKAETFFEGEPFVVINSDILIDIDLAALFNFHKKKKGIATMVLRRRETGSRFSYLEMDKKNRILDIIENPTSPDEVPPGAMMFTGVQILTAPLLSYLPTGREACIINNAYRPALAEGKKIFGFPYNGYWMDLGTIERYRQADQDIAPLGRL